MCNSVDATVQRQGLIETPAMGLINEPLNPTLELIFNLLTPEIRHIVAAESCRFIQVYTTL